jgi:hypothetical protein
MKLSIFNALKIDREQFLVDTTKNRLLKLFLQYLISPYVYTKNVEEGGLSDMDHMGQG